MARLCFCCDFYTSFLVCLILPAILSINDNYFYKVDNQDENTLLTFDSNIHHLHKRQVKNAAKEVSNKMKQFPQSPIKPEMENHPQLSSPITNSSITNISAEASTARPLNMDNTVGRNNQTGGDDEDISISRFSDSSLNFNETLRKHNITITQMDNHIYYNSTFKTDPKVGKLFWITMDNRTDVKVSELLSKSHRRAATVRLSFEFPFYGHIIRNVTIATGGFLYTGDYVHSWLAATQYIAPLMANFDTSLSNDSFIKYIDNGTAFTVLWENVSLQEKPDDGKFTFQATLHNTGNIVFVYQKVPIIIENIQDNNHPVKVGLSDAYIIDRTIFFVRRKTIYEYHRVHFRKEDIKNGTVIYLTAQLTCPGIKDCTSCLTKELPNFSCTWCPGLNKCSNGFDRNRQDWLVKGCDKKQIKQESECSQIFTSEPYEVSNPYHHDNNFDQIDDETRTSDRLLHEPSHAEIPANSVKMGMSGYVAVLFMFTLASGFVLWVMYAYRNPHTTSGQMLIKYRPSQWSWRRGEARYTAATIHM